MKICKKCGLEKNISLFNKGRNECKECMAKYKKEYAMKNSDKIKKYQSEFREKNSDSLKNYQKIYRTENYEKIKIYKKEYAIVNSEKINNYNRERSKRLDVKDQKKKYREDNKDYYKNYYKEYYNLNKEEIVSNVYKNKRNRIDNDPIFKLYIRISGLISNSFKLKSINKTKKTNEILGCSFEEFKLHLESKFEPWMNWENRGLYNGELNHGWDIDHIIPISSAESEDDIIKLNHYTNLQPLCSYINRVVKRDKINLTHLA